MNIYTTKCFSVDRPEISIFLKYMYDKFGVKYGLENRSVTCMTLKS